MTTLVLGEDKGVFAVPARYLGNTFNHFQAGVTILGMS